MEIIFFEEILLQSLAFIPQEKKKKLTGFFFWNIFYFVCLFWIVLNIFLRHQRNNIYFLSHVHDLSHAVWMYGSLLQ